MYLVVIGINSSMRNSVQCIILLLVCGVIGDEVKLVSVYEGESVTLHTDTNILKKDKILWRFGEKGSSILLVEMFNNKITYDESIDGKFKDRLLISDTQSGELLVKNMRIKHTGLYEAEIQTGTGTSYKRFSVTVKESPLVIGAGSSEVKSVSVTEGESVTLQTHLTKLQRDDLILWRFGDERALIAKGDMEDNKISLYDGADGSFSDRLKLNDQTGDLTITDSKPKHSGVYQLKISSNKQTLYKTFSVTVRGGGLSSGAVAGIILVCLFLLAYAICSFLVACLHFHRRKKEKVKEIFVDEGESLTLPAAGIKLFRLPDVIEWIYDDRETIAEINFKDNTPLTYNGADERFKDRLMLYEQTGDLDISDLRIQHSGLYKVKGTPWPLSKICTSYCQFNVTVTERIVQGKYGNAVTLHTGVTGLQKDDLILWMWVCGDGDIQIARFICGTEKPVYYDYRYIDNRFKKRLDINPQTGDLTIKDITRKHCEVYKVMICSNQRSTYRSFRIPILVPAEKGKPVNLKTEGEIQKDDQVEWSFREYPLKRISYNRITLVPINGDNSQTKYTDDERFKGRLKMDSKTGDLTITNTRETDEGVYTLKLINHKKEITNWVFSVVFDSARNDPAAGVPLLSEEV